MEVRNGGRRTVPDLIFRRVCEDIPLSPPLTDSATQSDDSFDEEGPACALAVSNKFGLTFYADAAGFGVARTIDIVTLSKELGNSAKSCSIQEICILYVKLSRIRFISLSSDELTIAVCAGNGYQLFDVISLVQQSGKFFFEEQVGGTNVPIKEFLWSPSNSKTYLVLSANGQLYSGVINAVSRIHDDDVTAACWSSDGKQIIYSRGGKNLVVTTFDFSSSFTFELEAPNEQDDLELSVDSLRWVPPNSLLVCFTGADTDGEIVECPLLVLTSSSGDITKEHTARFGLAFEGLFASVEPSVPLGGCGPLMLADYLEPWEMVVATCRKSIDDHIVLLGWLQESESCEVYALEVNDDKWMPRIQLSCSGGDNAVTGLAIDRTVMSLELPDPRDELSGNTFSPCPVLMCTTLEGKLSLFSFYRFGKKWQDLQIVRPPSELPESVARLVPYAEIAEESASPLLQAESCLQQKDGTESTIHQKGGADEEEKWEKAPDSELQKERLDKMRMEEVQATLGSQPFRKENLKMSEELKHEKSTIRTGNAVTSLSFPVDKKLQSSPENNAVFPLPSTKNLTSTTLSPAIRPESKPASLSSHKSPDSHERFSSVPPTGAFLQRRLEVKSAGITDTEAYFLTELDTVTKMANEIDALISSIEGKDASKTGAPSLMLTKEAFDKLEHGVSSLSNSCKLMKTELEQQWQLLEELHDESMQVDTWRAYVQSLLGQAADHKHQELWKRQKLHPEMDSTRKCVLKADQAVKQQIADLESHLHNLELNEKEAHGWLRSSKLSQNSVKHFQNLQYLYNTVNTQLAAAEQLAGCLALQMEELNISSRQQRKPNTTRSMILDIVNEPGNASISSSIEDGGVSSQGKNVTSYSQQTSANTQSTPLKSWQSDSGFAVQDSVRRRRNSMDSSWAYVGTVKTTVERSARVRPAETAVNDAASISRDVMKPRSLKTFNSPRKTSLSPTARMPQAILSAKPSSFNMPTSNVSQLTSGVEAANAGSGLPNIATKMKQASNNNGTNEVSAFGSLAVLSTTQNVRVSTPTPNTKLEPLKSLPSHPEVPKAGFSFGSRDQPATIPAPTTVSQPKKLNFQSAAKLVPPPFSLPAFGQISFGSAASLPVDSGFKTLSTSTATQTPTTSLAPVPSSSTVTQTLNKDRVKIGDTSLPPVVKAVPSTTTHASPVVSPTTQAQNLSVVSSLPSGAALKETAKVATGFKQPQSLEKPSDTSLTAITPELIASANSRTMADTATVSVPAVGFGQFSMSNLSASLAASSSSIAQSTLSLPSSRSMASMSASVASSLKASSFMPKQESLPSPQTQLPFSGSSLPLSSPAPGSSPAEMHEEDMEEAASTSFSDFGGFGGMGLGVPNQVNVPKVNPFGGPSFNTQSGTSLSLATPTGQLFRPAAFSLPTATASSPQLGSSFSSGFSQGLFAPNPAPGSYGSPTQPNAGGFGQPSQLGPGQQALGSALGAFGQTRQIGVGQTSSIPGGFGSVGRGGGFAAVSSGGGFANAATGGAFAAVSSAGGFQAFSAARTGGFSTGFGGSASFGSQQSSSPQDSSFKFQMRK